MSQIGKTRYMVQVAMLGAAAVVLMFFDIPLPFAPSFYKIDLSEVPVLIGAFAMGPLAGAAIELIKILLNLVMKGSTTAGVGEVANFLIGCAYVMPAAWIYKTQKTKKNAMIGMAVGTVFLAAAGGLLNAFVLLPAYAAAFWECRWMPLWEWDLQSTKQLQVFRPLFCLPLYRLISSKVLWYHW